MNYYKGSRKNKKFPSQRFKEKENGMCCVYNMYSICLLKSNMNK